MILVKRKFFTEVFRRVDSNVYAMRHCMHTTLIFLTFSNGMSSSLEEILSPKMRRASQME